jgi:hypothetical protein
VSAAADLDRARFSDDWHFLQLSRAGAVPRPLPYLPPAAVAQVGPQLEAVDLVCDGVGDVLWAVDRTILSADGRPRPMAPPPAGAPRVPPAPRRRPTGSGQPSARPSTPTACALASPDQS